MWKGALGCQEVAFRLALPLPPYVPLRIGLALLGFCFPFFFFFPQWGLHTGAQVAVRLGFCDSPGGVYWPRADFSPAPTFHSLLTQGLADSNQELCLGRKGVSNGLGQRGRTKDGEE